MYPARSASQTIFDYLHKREKRSEMVRDSARVTDRAQDDVVH